MEFREAEKMRARLISEYREKFANPWTVAELGFIDAVIDPGQTRPLVIQAFDILKTKKQAVPKKKHGNIPL